AAARRRGRGGPSWKVWASLSGQEAAGRIRPAAQRAGDRHAAPGILAGEPGFADQPARAAPRADPWVLPAVEGVEPRIAAPDERVRPRRELPLLVAELLPEALQHAVVELPPITVALQ